MIHEMKGSELIFLRRIQRDGSGTRMVRKDYIEMMKDDTFQVKCLSMSQKTYIAMGFNSFVVRLKDCPILKLNEIIKRSNDE